MIFKKFDYDFKKIFKRFQNDFQRLNYDFKILKGFQYLKKIWRFEDFEKI